MALQEMTVTLTFNGDNWWKMTASYQDGLHYQMPDNAVQKHTHTLVTQAQVCAHTQQKVLVVGTWLGDYKENIAPLCRAYWLHNI